MKNKFLEVLTPLLLSLIICLSLIGFVPFFADSFGLGKQIILLAGAVLLSILWMYKIYAEKKISLSKSYSFGILIGFFLVSLISTFINIKTGSKIASLTALLGGGSLFLCLVVYLQIINLNKGKYLYYFLLATGVLVSAFTLVLNIVKFNFPISFPSLGISLTPSFSLFGNLLSQTLFLASLLPIGFTFAYENLKEKKNLLAVLAFGINIIILASLGISINLLSSSAKPTLLPIGTAWNIGVEGLKEAKTALLGIGPGQYLNAFTAYKPLSFNNTNLWNLRFTGANWYFYLLTEIGVLGLTFFVLLAWNVAKRNFQLLRTARTPNLQLACGLSLTFLAITFFFLPSNLILLLTFFIILALFDESEEKAENKIEVDISPLGKSILLFAIFPIIFWGLLGYFAFRLGLSSNYYLDSLKAAERNDGAQTYNMQIKAINTNPWSSSYRVAYSNTNFVLANALATKQDLTDNDRNTISQLIQQAIREAKSAIALDPQNVTTWENLASLYQNLINFAQGADQWAVDSYQQAIRLDPLNPQLRLNLGGLFFGAKNYQQAAIFFNQAVSLKSDFANAHYNLANALKQLGAFADAKTEYEATLSLVPADSNDFQKVTAELEEVKKKLPQPTVTPGAPETLSTAQPPATGIKPPLELPEEGPPVTTEETPEEVSPTVQPQE